MKRNLALILGSLVTALALVAMLIPKAKPLTEDSDDPYWQAWREWQAASRDVRSVRDLVRRAEARATVRTLPTPAKPEIITRFDASLTPAQRDRLTTAFEAEARDAARGPLRNSVALVVTVPTRPGDFIFTYTTAQPERAGEPCTVLISASARFMERYALDPTERLLGTCGFYAAFGMPGSAVQQWLHDTRAASARYLRVPAAYAEDTALVDLARARSYRSVAEADLFGCRAGREAACARFVSPDPVARMQLDDYDTPRIEELAHFEPGVQVAGSGYMSNSLIQQRLLAKLAEELGSDRFVAIWTGTRSLQEAYVAETGHTLTEWTSAYVASRTTPYHAGPGVPLLSTLMALAMTIAFTAWAFARTARRMT